MLRMLVLKNDEVEFGYGSFKFFMYGQYGICMEHSLYLISHIFNSHGCRHCSGVDPNLRSSWYYDDDPYSIRILVKDKYVANVTSEG